LHASDTMHRTAACRTACLPVPYMHQRTWPARILEVVGEGIGSPARHQTLGTTGVKQMMRALGCQHAVVKQPVGVPSSCGSTGGMERWSCGPCMDCHVAGPSRCSAHCTGCATCQVLSGTCFRCGPVVQCSLRAGRQGATQAHVRRLGASGQEQKGCVACHSFRTTSGTLAIELRC
jgi:hypothetical protein